MAPEEGLFCKPEYRQFIVAYIFHFVYSVFCLSLTAVRISRSVYFYNFKCVTDPGLLKIWQLFSVPKIKQEYFHNNRYPTILSVVYITTFLFIVCICLTTSQSEDSEFLALLCTRHGRTSTACSTPLKCTSPGRFKRSPKRNAFAECPRCSSS